MGGFLADGWNQARGAMYKMGGGGRETVSAASWPRLPRTVVGPFAHGMLRRVGGESWGFDGRCEL